MNSALSGATDERLAVLAHGGDKDALESLLRRHYDTLRAVCHRIVIDSGNADDAVQNAALSIARGIRSFDSRSSVKTWMHRIAVNASLDEIRRTRRRPTLVPLDGVNPSDPRVNTAHDVAEQILVRKALLALDPEFRAVLALRHIAELEYEDIARELDLPIGTVKSRISRGRRQLAAVIGDNDDESSQDTSPTTTTHTAQGAHRVDT